MARRPINQQIAAAQIDVGAPRWATDRAQNRFECEALCSGQRYGRLGDEVAAVDAHLHASSSTLSSRVTQVSQYDFHTPSGMNQEYELFG